MKDKEIFELLKTLYRRYPKNTKGYLICRVIETLNQIKETI